MARPQTCPRGLSGRRGDRLPHQRPHRRGHDEPVSRLAPPHLGCRPDRRQSCKNTSYGSVATCLLSRPCMVRRGSFFTNRGIGRHCCQRRALGRTTAYCSWMNGQRADATSWRSGAGPSKPSYPRWTVARWRAGVTRRGGGRFCHVLHSLMTTLRPHAGEETIERRRPVQPVLGCPRGLEAASVTLWWRRSARTRLPREDSRDPGEWSPPPTSRRRVDR